MPQLICEHCGRTFYAGRPDKRTCSTKCRVALHRKRRAHGDPDALLLDLDVLLAERDELNRWMEHPDGRTAANYDRREAIDRMLARRRPDR